MQLLELRDRVEVVSSYPIFMTPTLCTSAKWFSPNPAAKTIHLRSCSFGIWRIWSHSSQEVNSNLRWYLTGTWFTFRMHACGRRVPRPRPAFKAVIGFRPEWLELGAGSGLNFSGEALLYFVLSVQHRLRTQVPVFLSAFKVAQYPGFLRLTFANLEIHADRLFAFLIC